MVQVELIREEINLALSEQVVDGPPRMDPQFGAEMARQGRNPVTMERESDPIETLSIVREPACRETGTLLAPAASYFESEDMSTGYRQLSSGYVELTDTRCRGVRESEGDNWGGVTGTLNGAISIFFDQEKMGGMLFKPRSTPRASLSEYWLANQLLKYDVGFSRRRERPVEEPEPLDMGSIFGSDDVGDIEEDTPVGDSQWLSRHGFDNPYAQDIFEKLYSADTSSGRNKVDQERVMALASRLYEKQIEIKGDARKALIAVYDCYEMGPAAGAGRALLDKIGLDPFGESLSYCRFIGWTLNPMQADMHRRTYIT